MTRQDVPYSLCPFSALGLRWARSLRSPGFFQWGWYWESLICSPGVLTAHTQTLSLSPLLFYLKIECIMSSYWFSFRAARFLPNPMGLITVSAFSLTEHLVFSRASTWLVISFIPHHIQHFQKATPTLAAVFLLKTVHKVFAVFWRRVIEVIRSPYFKVTWRSPSLSSSTANRMHS